MFLSFITAGLFFANSGMFDEDGNFDKAKTYDIIQELENVPLINIDIEEESYWDNVKDNCADGKDCPLDNTP